MKAVVFGAGNIGRGFLGSLLSKADFFTTFIDVDEQKVILINREREYPVLIVSSAGVQEEIVQNIAAIALSDSESVVNAVAEADVILTAVGKEAMGRVAVYLAQGLIQRISRRPDSEIHVVVVACENVQDNTNYLKELIFSNIPGEQRGRIESLISFPNCVVDRIVPNILPEGGSASPLAVAVEEYFQFAIDGSALKAEFPAIGGVSVADDIGAILEQKLFTLNMAHAIVAYYGYLRGYQFVHEAVGDAEIAALLEGAFAEVQAVIVSRHSSIPADLQKEYAGKVIARFKNHYLKDEIVRVARQPKRKLGRHDRLIKPAMIAWEQGMIPAHLATGITAALRYDYANDEQARQLVREIREKGIERILRETSGLAPNDELTRLIKADFLFKAL